MGTRRTFRCSACGSEAQVSGGLDYGMRVVVRTMTCADCAELVDVPTGGQGLEGSTGDRRFDRTLNRCPRCRGRRLAPWTHPGPCPRCGEQMVVDEAAGDMLWD